MNMYSVAPQITILRSIGNKKFSSNTLWENTGLEKSEYYANLQELRYLDFLLEESDPKYSQKLFYSLTELGKSLYELVEESYLYRDRYIKLLNGIIEKIWFLKDIRDNPLLLSSKFEMLSDEDKKRRTKLEFKMQSLGWTKEEIIFNQECLRNLIDLKHVCEVNFFFTLMFRFSIIKWKFLSTGKWKKKENQKEDLVKNILFDLLKDKTLTMLDIEKYGDLATYEFTGYGYMPLYDEKMDYQIKNRIHGGIFNLLYDMMKIYVQPLPFVLKKEIEEVSKSYFSIIDPLFLGKNMKSKMFILDEFKSDIEEEKRNLSNIAETQLKNKMFVGELNSFDYFMTNSNECDYKKLRIRSMELFQKLVRI